MFIEAYSLKLNNKILLQKTNLQFSSGKINHLLGKNGVGKSQLAKDFLLNRSGKFTKEIVENTTIISSFSNIPKELSVNDLSRLNLDNSLYTLLKLETINPELSIYKLSDGQKQKLKLWFFLSKCKNIIILDEITNAIDKVTVNEIYKFLTSYQQKYPEKIIINITHNLSDLSHIEGNYFIFDNLTISSVDTKEEAIKWYMGE